MAKRDSSRKSGLTRRQSSRIRREERLQRTVVISTAVVAVVVVGLVGYALVNEFILIPNRALVEIYGEKVTATEFENQVRFDYYRSFGPTPIQEVTQQYGLDAAYFGQIVFDGMVNDIVLRNKAEEMDISVSEAEVQEELELSFGYDSGDPEPTSTPQPTRVSSTPTITPTFIYTLTPSPTPTLAEGVTPTATVTPSPTASGPTATPSPTAARTPLPTATPVDEEGFQEALENFVDNFSTITGLEPGVIRQLIENDIRMNLLREKVQEELEFDFEQTTVRVHAAHILVETQEQAIEVLERLESGEDFAEVAAEMSLDTSNAYRGGDLGWFGEGQMVAEFEEVALSLEPGETSGPVQTQFGWHIIHVYDRVEEPLTADQIAQEEANQLREQINEWRDEANPIIDDTWQEYIPDQLP